MRPFLPQELLTGPFTSSRARACGLTKDMLDGDAWRQLCRNVWVSAAIPDSLELRAAAVGLLDPREAFLWRRGAAWLHGVDVRRGPQRELLEVGCHNRRRIRPRPAWAVSELSPGEGDIECVRGIPVTSPTRTAFDCARFLPVPDAVAVIDFLVRADRTTVSEVQAYTDKQFHIRHQRRVPGVLDLVDARAESVPESRLRVWLVLDGFRVVPQYVVMDGARFVARLDLALVEAKIAIEYDGEWHGGRMSLDEQRRARLEALGWRVIKVYAEDLRTDAARRLLMARIRAAVLSR